MNAATVGGYAHPTKLARTQREVPTLEALAGWSDLRSVRCGQVALADGNKFFNRSGTTIVETVEIIAEILHGDRFPTSWRGTAWKPYVAKACAADLHADVRINHFL